MEGERGPARGAGPSPSLPHRHRCCVPCPISPHSTSVITKADRTTAEVWKRMNTANRRRSGSSTVHPEVPRTPAVLKV